MLNSPTRLVPWRWRKINNVNKQDKMLPTVTYFKIISLQILITKGLVTKLETNNELINMLHPS